MKYIIAILTIDILVKIILSIYFRKKILEYFDEVTTLLVDIALSNSTIEDKISRIHFSDRILFKTTMTDDPDKLYNDYIVKKKSKMDNIEIINEGDTDYEED